MGAVNHIRIHRRGHLRYSTPLLVTPCSEYPDQRKKHSFLIILKTWPARQMLLQELSNIRTPVEARRGGCMVVRGQAHGQSHLILLGIRRFGYRHRDSEAQRTAKTSFFVTATETARETEKTLSCRSLFLSAVLSR